MVYNVVRSTETFDCNVFCNRDGTAAEGITLISAAFGSPSHIRSHFSKFVSKIESILLSLTDIDNPQIAVQLQRYCASTCLVSHLLCCTPPGLLQNICVHSRLNYPRGLCRHTRHPSGAVAAPEVLLDPGHSSNSTRRRWVDTCVSDRRCCLRWICYRHL